ncbi:MAG: hypothetical protein WDM92_07000 [Caulobacteraceae bacterium]
MNRNQAILAAAVAAAAMTRRRAMIGFGGGFLAGHAGGRHKAGGLAEADAGVALALLRPSARRRRAAGDDAQAGGLRRLDHPHRHLGRPAPGLRADDPRARSVQVLRRLCAGLAGAGGPAGGLGARRRALRRRPRLRRPPGDPAEGPGLARRRPTRGQRRRRLHLRGQAAPTSASPATG